MIAWQFLPRADQNDGYISGFWPAFPSRRMAARLLLAGSMNAKARALQTRTSAFLNDVIRFVESLPETRITKRIVPQLLDAAGSTDSNYRSACRARSHREFIAKLGVAAEEADESKGWLEALTAANLGAHEQAAHLIDEADQLTAIFVASLKTATRNAEKPKPTLPRSRR